MSKAKGIISYRIGAKRQYIEFEQSENISSSSFVNIFHESEYIDRKKNKSKNRRIFSSYSCSFCLFRGSPKRSMSFWGSRIWVWALPIMHLTGQMRCSHLVVFFKFSAKNITHCRGEAFHTYIKNSILN